MQALLIGAAVGVVALAVIFFRRERSGRLALEEREKRFRLTMECSAIAMALMGPDGRWLAVNRALCRLSGYREEELLASSFQQMIYPDDLQEDLQQLGAILAGRGESLRLEKRYVTKAGELVWVRLSIAAVSEDGSVRYLIVQCEDIQAAKEAEHALAESRHHQVAVGWRLGDAQPPAQTTRDLGRIVELVDQGTLKTIIDRVFPLSETAEAHRYLASRAQFGKVILHP
mgnify:CR=1 FL=1